MSPAIPRTTARRRVALALAFAATCAIVATGAPQAPAAWSGPVAVSNPASTAVPVDLQAAANRLGHAGLVWTDSSGGDDAAVSFRAPGGAFGQFSLLGGTGSDTDPAISLGANGAAIVSWDNANGTLDAIQARARSSGGAALGGILNLIGPVDENQIALPAVDVFDGAGGLGVVNFAHFSGVCSGTCFSRVGASLFTGPGSFSTVANQSPGTSVLGNGAYQSTDVETHTDGSAVVVGFSNVNPGARDIAVAARTSGGSWDSGALLASTTHTNNGPAGNDPGGAGCLCGSIPRIARLANGDVAITYDRNASPGDDNIQFATFTVARAMQGGAPFVSETTLNAAGDTGVAPKIASDAAGNVIVGWVDEDDQVLTRYRTAAGVWQPTQQAGTGASQAAGDFGLAMAEDGEAFVGFISGGAVRTAVRPAGASSAWGASQSVSGTTTSPEVLDVAAGNGEGFIGFVARAAADNLRRVYGSVYTPAKPKAQPKKKAKKKCVKGKKKKGKKRAGAGAKKKGKKKAKKCKKKAKKKGKKKRR